jgi:hypothetical protein
VTLVVKRSSTRGDSFEVLATDKMSVVQAGRRDRPADRLAFFCVWTSGVGALVGLVAGFDDQQGLIPRRLDGLATAARPIDFHSVDGRLGR